MVTNASVPTSILNKLHNEICYHRLRESQAADKILVGWVPGKRNVADFLTKTNIDGNAMHSIVEIIFNNKAVKWKYDNNDDSRFG